MVGSELASVGDDRTWWSDMRAGWGAEHLVEASMALESLNMGFNRDQGPEIFLRDGEWLTRSVGPPED